MFGPLFRSLDRDLDLDLGLVESIVIVGLDLDLLIKSRSRSRPIDLVFKSKTCRTKQEDLKFCSID